jgi:hypothetical protein
MAVLVGAAVALSAGPADAKRKPPAGKAAAEQRIEPEAIAALTRMGDHLAALQSFSIRTTSSTEIFDGDQALLIEGSGVYQVRRPDRLTIDFRRDDVHRQLFYDGKSVTLVAPEQKYYAVFDAPPTIKDMLEKAAQKYDLSLPLADLFAWGTKDAPLKDIKEGFRVGTAYVGGKEADHWAFRSVDQDWEVWIQASGPPLPLKLSLVDRLLPHQPRFSIDLDWSEGATFADDAFVYTPPPGAAKISFASDGGTP